MTALIKQHGAHTMQISNKSIVDTVTAYVASFQRLTHSTKTENYESFRCTHYEYYRSRIVGIQAITYGLNSQTDKVITQAFLDLDSYLEIFENRLKTQSIALQIIEEIEIHGLSGDYARTPAGASGVVGQGCN
ncbi:hypothetical protein [Methylomonas sp. AM2-LC]|uniref:hypothetical protein n=1 Tax=Methylomonas sp. AM2-LC TaxID=3153301 RepID=UPI003266BE51